MPPVVSSAEADRGPRRASFQRARSHETKRMLVQAAMALWRTKGYANTTAAEICTAAGVSKALFYFYFPRKEDVLFEVGVMSTQSAQRTIHELLTKSSYDIGDVIFAALKTLEKSMTRNPPELVIETILEGYRHEHRIIADGAPVGDAAMFTELFERAQSDGALGSNLDAADVAHLAYLAQTLVSEGARHWAAGSFGDRTFSDVVTADILTLIAGQRSRAEEQRRP